MRFWSCHSTLEEDIAHFYADGFCIMMLVGEDTNTPQHILSQIDTLDLTGAGEGNNPGGRVAVDYEDNRRDGTVRFLDAEGVQTGSLRFEDVEYVIEDVTCLTPGTLIATPKGEVPIESLRVGDRAITRDNGLQDIKWIGHRILAETDLLLSPRLRPVMVRAGALGNDMPESDMMLSPNHRVLVSDGYAAPGSYDASVLVAAQDLTGLEGVELMDPQDIVYSHIIFACHEVILCNGTWIECFHAGDLVFRGAGNAQRLELLELYPELRARESLSDYKSESQLMQMHGR